MACYARVRGGCHGGDPSMACKGSGVQIPSAPPQVRGSLRLASRPIRRRRAADLQQNAERDPVRAASATSSRLLLPLGRNAKRDRAASSIARVTRASIAGVSPIDPPNGLRAEARSRWPPEWPISGRAGSVPASSDSPWPPDPSSTFAMSATTLLPAAAVGASNRTPGASLSSDDFGSSVERTATLHPLWKTGAPCARRRQRYLT
jgi:hypothetical protein